MDLTDPSACGSIQPFPVVVLLAYKAVTDKGADKPQLITIGNKTSWFQHHAHQIGTSLPLICTSQNVLSDLRNLF